MKRMYMALIIICLSVLSINANVIMSTSPDKVLSLNGDWKFKYIPSQTIGQDSNFYKTSFDIHAWGILKVPACWDRVGVTGPSYGGEVADVKGLYRRTFTLPKGWSGENIFIAFDGVGFGYRFWINGRYAGAYSSAFNRKVFAVSQFVNFEGENIIAVEVSTHSRGWRFDTCDDWSFSGIFRDVTLFSTPKTFMSDIEIVTKIPQADRAVLEVKAHLTGKSPSSIGATLTDLDGKTVKKFWLTASADGNYVAKETIANPRLWNAENPELYYLNIDLQQNGQTVQQQKFRFGFREVTIEGAVIKLNGTPIKLRGVALHEESPVNGRTMTDIERLRDLELIKKANINFIRTSHYPPSHRLIEMCDSLGLYVMDEVPFAGYGGGRELLAKPEYRDDILERVHATIFRDKNYTSVIVWSLGNENPLTDNGIEAGRLIRKLDPSSRPFCMPMMGSYFGSVKYEFPDSIDIYAPHYPSITSLVDFETHPSFCRPFIITEYAHAFGLGFDRLEKSWDFIYPSKRIAGGAIWHFFDQGLLKKSIRAVNKNNFSQYCWIDPYTYYDSSKDRGTDGIVYADRQPQQDYWLVRKVYSPVFVNVDTLNVGVGKQILTIEVENRYDFINLSTLKMEWKLHANNDVIQRGNVPLSCEPKQIMIQNIEIDMPAEKKAALFTLALQYTDKAGVQVYERNIVLHTPNTERITKESVATGIKPRFAFDYNTATASLSTSAGKRLIENMPTLRVGRKMALWNLYDFDDASPDSINITVADAWFPANIGNPKILSLNKNGDVINVVCSFFRPDDITQAISGTISYTLNDLGWIEVAYDLKPSGAKGVFLEAGISMVIPYELSEFRFIGKGPYPSYPGKSRHNEPGIYHINNGDINFAGSYSGIDVAVFTDALGEGFAILPEGSAISTERAEQGVILSHTPFVSGTYAKKSMPDEKINVATVGAIRGNFTIIPLEGEWKRNMERIFGQQRITAKPFAPYYHSYDQ